MYANNLIRECDHLLSARHLQNLFNYTHALWHAGDWRCMFHTHNPRHSSFSFYWHETLQANSPPTLIATSAFLGLGVLSSDEYTGGGVGTDGQDQEYYVNTANFYRQIRNIKIDITKTRAAQGVAGLHWQVAQVSKLPSSISLLQSSTLLLL